MLNLPQEKLRKNYAKEFMQFFEKASCSKDITIRKNAAFNLPCYFYYFNQYSPSDELDFTELYCEFSEDENSTIREITAKGIHEILSLTSNQGKSPF
mmetsp:Transcript_3176/g.2131  ORF Transcript_3176/g.2131 Transcript_3176/m.2131 type:complete len:97 (-) Transcript_3176:1323-1613(-)|eukprot:CAMPEP_0202978418 /NCGR_PEP_ID=MMETSP1396-20130829/84844_1 /ASSEMBLY_ACC=CAM_ASM_000872 /TAXON_ID= /ORGANISM="Pseudokeronopsis sp., Strain Brazil" /LENGTH=96 /DNA_ID=CAMNT_0049717377 /DNA_START=445 /DNA_END=735 /DNA_ORIENTATION=-